MGDYVVDDIWLGRRLGPARLTVDGRRRVHVEPAAPRTAKTPVTVLPGVVDRHVHLGLVDRERLAGGLLVEVHDLGWAPDEAAGFRSDPPAGVAVRIAGPFHTAPRGYPSGRSWAPSDSVRVVANVAAADRAVADAVRRKVDVFKIALHAEMPLLGDDVLERLVTSAHTAGLAVGVHAEGSGQARRAIDVGADVLVHAPWTELLPDHVLQRGRSMTWISTLSIHSPDDREVAIENVRRFREVGGQVVYGTDMGNGPTPVGLNYEEIVALGSAGLSGEELLTALAGDCAGPVSVDRLLVSPHPLPASAGEAVAWFADAVRLPTAHLEERHARP